MEKEEFPTFLNEQPKIVFGRTGREMLIIACGCVVAYSSWGPITHLLGLQGLGGLVAHILLAAIPILIAVSVALISIADRPLEEWFMVLAVYTFLPKLFLYAPLEEEERDGERHDQKRVRAASHTYDENDNDSD